MNREMRIRWTIVAAYAAAMLLIGALVEWRAPLRYDEWRYYVPTIRFLASRLPAMPLDYGPSNAPPLGLFVQALVFSLTGSVAVLRAMSTLATIAAVAAVAHLLRDVEGRSARVLPLLVGLFPTFALHTFTLKHYGFELLLLAVGFSALLRRHRAGAAVALAAAALTREAALAFVAALAAEPFFRFVRRRDRESLLDLAALSVPFLCLMALFAYWHGTEPPTFRLTSPDLKLARYQLPYAPALQVIVTLFVLGAWVVPAVDGWWRRWPVIAAAFPFAAFAVYRSDLLLAHDVQRPGFVFTRMVGPLSSILFHVPSMGARVVAAAVLVAAGTSMFAWRGRATALWLAVIYVVMAVGFRVFFESYYAELVAGCWLLMRREVAESSSLAVHLFQAAAMLAGLGYLWIGPTVG